MFNQRHSVIRALLLSAVAFTITIGALPGKTAQAQIINTPLIFHIGAVQSGDLWSAAAPGAPLKPLTNYHYNFAPVLSPDGKYVAYLSLPRFAVQDMAHNGTGEGGGYPTNVWVLNIATGNAVKIADQLPDAGVSSLNRIWRPTPAWSPDSKQLAWVEMTGSPTGKPQYQLVAYDISTQQPTFTAKAPGLQLTAAGTAGETVAWSAAGIAYTVPGGEEPATNKTIPSMFYLYDAHGKQLVALPLTDPTCGIYGWIRKPQPVAILCSMVDQSPVYLGFNPKDSTIQSIDVLQSNGVINGFYLDSAVKSGANELIGNPDATKPLFNWQWVGYEFPDPVAISPDGTMVAAINEYGEGSRPPDGKSYSVFTVDGNYVNYTGSYVLTMNNDQAIDWIGWGPTILQGTSANN